MDKARRDYWRGYLRVLADELELRDWAVGIGARFAVLGANAEVECAVGHKVATVFLCEGWDDRPPAAQRKTLVHELLHAHFDPGEKQLALARQNMRLDWLDLLEGNLLAAHEVIISVLSDIIAPRMPLPPSVEQVGNQMYGTLAQMAHLEEMLRIEHAEEAEAIAHKVAMKRVQIQALELLLESVPAMRALEL